MTAPALHLHNHLLNIISPPFLSAPWHLYILCAPLHLRTSILAPVQLCTTAPLHLCTMLHLCTLSASLHLCIISASLHLCTISASSLHHLCIISASSLHHLCIISASSLHLCTSAPLHLCTSAPAPAPQCLNLSATLQPCTSTAPHSAPLHLLSIHCMFAPTLNMKNHQHNHFC